MSKLSLDFTTHDHCCDREFGLTGWLRKMINGKWTTLVQHFSSVQTTQSAWHYSFAFTKSLTHTHTNSYTNGTDFRTGHQHAHGEQFRDKHFAQGHIDISTGGTRNQTTDWRSVVWWSALLWAIERKESAYEYSTYTIYWCVVHIKQYTVCFMHFSATSFCD